MPFSFEAINKYLPLIQTGLGITGQYLGGRAQTNAMTQAGQINQQATNDAMQTILGLYDQGQSQLAPYRSVGTPALNNLQRLANPGRPMPQIQAPPPPATGNSMARFAGPSAANPMGGSVTGAMAGNPQQQAGANAGKNAMLGSLAGAAALPIGGAVLGSTLGSGLGMGGALGGASWALGGLAGPIGLAAGLGGSLIASQFGKNNPYKATASKGIDQVSRNIWGTNTPGIAPEQLTSGYVADAMQRRISPAEAKAKINADLNEWVAGMRANGTPDSVLQSSIATQKQALAPLRDVFARLEQPGQIA